MHLGCNPLGTLNINTKHLTPWATRQPRQTAKHREESHTLLLMSPCNNNTKFYCKPAADRSFMQRAMCISLICLPFHKDMYGDSHQGIQTQHGLIFMAIKLSVGFRSLCCSLWSVTAESLHNLLAPRDIQGSTTFFRAPAKTHHEKLNLQGFVLADLAF